MNRRAIAYLAAAHLCDDVNQGVIPALIPFFVLERGFSITAAAGLVFASNVSSSVLQPLFGMLADRRPTPWLVPAGLFLAGAGVAAAGLAPTYPLVLASCGATGIGVAAFHPEAARQVYLLSGDRRATAMSFFATGGNLGFAIGPAVATPIQIALGLRGTALLIVPAATMALFLVRAGATRLSPEAGAAATRRETPRDRWWPFARLSGPVLGRAVVFYALTRSSRSTGFASSAHPRRPRAPPSLSCSRRASRVRSRAAGSPIVSAGASSSSDPCSCSLPSSSHSFRSIEWLSASR